MRKIAPLLIACTAAACAQPTDSGESPSSEDGQTTAALTRSSTSTVALRSQDSTGALAHLRGAFPDQLRRGPTPVAATIAFLEAHRSTLGIVEPGVELRGIRTEVDDRASTHVRLQQVHRGLPVLGSEVSAHYDAAGALTAISSTYVPGIDRALSVTPSLTEPDALLRAEDVVRAIDSRTTTVPVESSVLGVWAPSKGAARLVYRFGLNVSSPRFIRRVVLVDAHSGDIVFEYDNLQTIEGSGTGALGDTKKIEVAQEGASFILNDTSRAAAVRTYRLNPANQQGEIVTSSDRNTWEADVTVGRGSAVDAHFNAAVVADYYLQTHKRSGIDGASGALLSVTHVNEDPDNAAWNGELMLYGDGQQVFKPLAAALDVVGHEFTHGVTQATSNLEYMGESGALNEAVSDVFAAFIEHRVKPGEQNWYIAEDIVKLGGSLRNMVHPTEGLGSVKPRAHMSTLWKTDQDNGGVHINSGIPSNAAYLMTVGGTNDISKIAVPKGIGWEKSEQLWYLANTKYFQIRTDFAGAADATMDAAKELGFTEEEQSIVDCAWIAVGVRTATKCTIAASATDPNGSGSGDPGDDLGGDGTSDGDTIESRPARGLRAGQGDAGCSSAPHSPGDGAGFGWIAGLAVAAAAMRRRQS